LKFEKSKIIFLRDHNLIDSLLEVASLYSTDDYVKVQHLVILREQMKTKGEVREKIFDDDKFILRNEFLSHVLNYIVFMVRYKDGFQLETIERFTKEDCGYNLTVINEYSFYHETWKNESFGLLESWNFNGCKIYLSFPLKSSNPMYNTNLLKRIFQEMSGKLNYKFSITTRNVTDHAKNVFKIDKDESYSRIIEAAMGSFSHEAWVIKTFKIMISMMDFAVIIPIGEEYSAYEKFILPFEPYTWVCCGVTFGIAFLVIILINLINNRKLKDFVYGQNVNTPAFNVLIAFFGQSQNILPGGNFARFQLMMLILLCFFIRSLYQGIQFDMNYMVRFLLVQT
jgi:hypothetical protein